MKHAKLRLRRVRVGDYVANGNALHRTTLIAYDDIIAFDIVGNFLDETHCFRFACSEVNRERHNAVHTPRSGQWPWIIARTRGNGQKNENTNYRECRIHHGYKYTSN